MKPKRLISLLVAVCMVVVMLPVSAFAADTTEYTSGNYKYTLDSKGNATITGYTVAGNDLVVPSEIDGYPVTVVGKYAFAQKWGCTGTIEIPASVVKLDEGAFQWSEATKIIFAENSALKVVGIDAFSGCAAVEEVVLPDSVTTIETGAFQNCLKLKKLFVPQSVETIGERLLNIGSEYKNKSVFPKYIYYNGTNDVLFDGKIDTTEDQIKHPHMVVFVMNGHGTAPADQIVYTGDPIEKVAAPTAAGYTFGGWYTDKELTQAFDIENDTISVDTTLYAKWVAIPATMTTNTEKVTCAIGEPAKIDFTINANGEAGKPAIVNMEFSNESALEKLRVGVGDQWKDLPTKNSKIEIASLAAMSGQLEATFHKAGNYTLTVTMKTDAGTTVAKTINITVGEKAAEIVPATQLYDLTIKNADVTIKNGDEELKAEKNDKGELIAKVPENADVTVTYTSQSDAVAFEQWTVTTDKELDVDVKTNPLTFKMPAGGVTVEAMTKDASIEEEPNVLGTAAVIGAAAVGTAVLAWQGYELGTELYLKYALPAGAAIPTNRAELAELVWNNAGKPEPVAVLPADAAETEKAIAWAVENDLLKATKDNGEAYEETDSVSKLEVIQCWNKAVSNQ